MTSLAFTDVKKYLRYEDADTSNDSTISLIVDAGQRYIENYTGHILVQREVVESLTTFPVARVTGEVPYHDLRWKPYVDDSLEVGYLDGDYATQTFADVTLYPHSGTTRVIPTSAWPGEYLGVTFTYTAGYATAADVPDDLILALAVFTSMTDEERCAPESAGWMALDRILTPYRLPVLA